MRKLMLVCAAALLQSAVVNAEPFALEQAGNVLKPKTLETGVASLSYQYDESIITNTAGTTVLTVKNTATLVPLFARYAFTSNVEGYLSIPYASTDSKSETAAGVSTTATDSGLADPTVAGKYSFACCGIDMSGVMALTVPAGKSSFKQGLNIKPVFAARKEFGKIIANANLSYSLNSEYDDENSVKRDPGDVMLAGIGAEWPCKYNDKLQWAGEFIYSAVSEGKNAGVAEVGSSGSRMDFVLGARYNTGNFKTKLGFDLSLGDEKYRTYDYKVIAGVTYLIGL